MPLRYAPEASAQLDKLELGSDEELWNAVCAAIDLIADRPDSPEARREALRTGDGNTVWRVPVRHSKVDDYCVLWALQADIEYVLFVGPM